MFDMKKVKMYRLYMLYENVFLSFSMNSPTVNCAKLKQGSGYCSFQ